MKFLQGVIMGLSIAAPVGPIGMLCIQRTLNYGRKAGLLSGFGAATADLIYGAIAAFGVVGIVNLISQIILPVRIIGSLFLLFLGLKTILGKPGNLVNPSGVQSGYFASTFLLTMTNPMTILSFAAIMTGSGIIQNQAALPVTLLFILGVFTGSALWWFILSSAVGWLSKMVTPTWLDWINRISGSILIIFAALNIVGLFK